MGFAGGKVLLPYCADEGPASLAKNIAFLKGLGQWTGCSWPTEFGNTKLNLEGLKASQAALMAGSTSGKERDDWAAATHWLEQVELDAREAEREAELARDLANREQAQRAWLRIERACALQRKYTQKGLAWEPLRMVIAKRLPRVDPDHR